MAGPSPSTAGGAAPLAEPPTVHHGVPDTRGRAISPWAWIPSANFAQGLQYMMVTNTYIVILFTMGVDMGRAALVASLLGLPWTVKPMWGPLVDRYWTKRNWTIYMQLVVGICFSLACLALQSPLFFYLSLGPLLLLAFSAASHDIALDGYYMMALSERQQAFFVGIRSTAFRGAMLAATGLFPFMAGVIQDNTGLKPAGIEVVAVVDDNWKPGQPVEAVGPRERVWLLNVVPLPLFFSEPVDLSSAPGEPVKYERLRSLKTLASQSTQPPEIIFEPTQVTVKAGQEATFTIRLANAPDDGTTTVLTLRHGQGDEGTAAKNTAQNRLEFGPDSWDDPVTVTLKTDKKLKGSKATEIRASAGNIRLSWTIVVASCAGIFLFAFGLHWLVLPYPAADVPWVGPDGTRKPFWVPLLALTGVIGPPLVLFVGGINSLWHLGRTPILNWYVRVINDGEKLVGVALKGFDFGLLVFGWLVLIAIGALLVALPATRRSMGAYSQRMSDVSGIGFAEVFQTFFSKPSIWIILGFLLTFRLGEVQLSVAKNFFLLGERNPGSTLSGLGMSLTEFGITNGVVYVITLIIGGILGGWTISNWGLKRAIWPMVAAMHLPNLLYYFMAAVDVESLWVINTCVGLESFGYGFGFAFYLFYMIYVAQGPYKTAHYALCTGFMSLGAQIPTMWSGFLVELIGYEGFFIWVIVACLPGLLFIPFLPLDPEFGMKKKAPKPVGDGETSVN